MIPSGSKGFKSSCRNWAPPTNCAYREQAVLSSIEPAKLRSRPPASIPAQTSLAKATCECCDAALGPTSRTPARTQGKVACRRKLRSRPQAAGRFLWAPRRRGGRRSRIAPNRRAATAGQIRFRNDDCVWLAVLSSGPTGAARLCVRGCPVALRRPPRLPGRGGARRKRAKRGSSCPNIHAGSPRRGHGQVFTKRLRHRSSPIWNGHFPLGAARTEVWVPRYVAFPPSHYDPAKTLQIASDWEAIKPLFTGE